MSRISLYCHTTHSLYDLTIWMKLWKKFMSKNSPKGCIMAWPILKQHFDRTVTRGHVFVSGCVLIDQNANLTLMGHRSMQMPVFCITDRCIIVLFSHLREVIWCSVILFTIILPCALHAVINILNNICAVQCRRSGMSYCRFVCSASWICHNMHFVIDIIW